MACLGRCTEDKGAVAYSGQDFKEYRHVPHRGALASINCFGMISDALRMANVPVLSLVHRVTRCRAFAY